jgi:hypothetical protein
MASDEIVVLPPLAAGISHRDAREIAFRAWLVEDLSDGMKAERSNS